MYYKDYINNFREYNSYEDFYQHYELNVPDEFNFAYDVVERAGLEFPDREALVWHDQEDVKRFTFADLSKASSRTAHYFKSLGINKGDAVMVMLKNRYEFWFCLLALHRIGAIAVPATHMLTKKDILYRNTKASIKAIVSIHDERLLQAVDETMEVSDSLKIRVLIEGQREGWSNLHEGIKGMSEVFERPTGVNRIKNEDTMLLYFTSGTTGDPKMVEHCFTYPLGHITTARYWHRVIDGGLHYTLADTGWAKAVWGKIYGQWLCGSAVFVAEYKKFTPTDVLVDIQKFGVTTFCAPPTIYRFLIQNGLREYDLSSLKHCTVAGEPLSAVVFSKFKDYTGIELCEAYGQTEVTVVSGTFPGVTPKPGSMGKAAPGYELLLVDENDEPVEVGEEGEIVILTKEKTPVGMFSGYYRAKNYTNSVWSNGMYHTGDTAWKDQDGYFWFVGRADDVIKSSGYRIGPFEVESALMSHPAVVECAITGVPDPVRGQVVKATITLAKGYVASDDLVVDIQSHVKKVTAPYKYPRVVEFVEELPKTISGKIRRTEIRKHK